MSSLRRLAESREAQERLIQDAAHELLLAVDPLDEHGLDDPGAVRGWAVPVATEVV